MSCNSVGLPSSFDRFREVWEHDFEYRQDANHCPVPVALSAKEQRTGTEISMRREQLLASTRLPFGQGLDTLVTSYSNVAELNCLNMLGYPIPTNLLCTYTETCAAINGLDIDGLIEKRPSILEACDLFDIPHMTKEHKAHMRDLILNNTEYTEDQWREIEKYNREDVLEEGAILEAIAPKIDLPAALFRGRYAKAVSPMELRGLPVDVDYLRTLET